MCAITCHVVWKCTLSWCQGCLCQTRIVRPLKWPWHSSVTGIAASLLLAALKKGGFSQFVDLWLNCWSSQHELHWLFSIFNVLIYQVLLIEINFWNKVFLGVIRTHIINLRTQLAFIKYLLCAKYYSQPFAGIDLLPSQRFSE